MIYNTTFTDISNSFQSWAGSSNTGDATIERLDVEYCNRALEMLQSEPAHGWDYLCKTSQLTISNNTAALPSDVGRIVDIYSDTDGDGKADLYYFREGRPYEGFRLNVSFSKEFGHSFSVVFFQSPPEPVYVRYQVELEPVTGTGTEYVFFPKNLTLLAMKVCRIVDKGILQEYQAIMNEYQRELSKYKQQHQNTLSGSGVQVNDSRGAPIFLPLAGMQIDGARGVVGRTNDQDVYYRGN